MICTPCRDAADRRAPRDQHCTDPGCTCGHRTDRYQAVTVDDRTPAVPLSVPLIEAADPPINLGAHLNYNPEET